MGRPNKEAISASPLLSFRRKTVYANSGRCASAEMKSWRSVSAVVNCSRCTESMPGCKKCTCTWSRWRSWAMEASQTTLLPPMSVDFRTSCSTHWRTKQRKTFAPCSFLDRRKRTRLEGQQHHGQTILFKMQCLIYLYSVLGHACHSSVNGTKKVHDSRDSGASCWDERLCSQLPLQLARWFPLLRLRRKGKETQADKRADVHYRTVRYSTVQDCHVSQTPRSFRRPRLSWCLPA